MSVLLRRSTYVTGHSSSYGYVQRTVTIYSYTYTKLYICTHIHVTNTCPVYTKNVEFYQYMTSCTL